MMIYSDLRVFWGAFSLSQRCRYIARSSGKANQVH
jgi:hypothetical protein